MVNALSSSAPSAHPEAILQVSGQVVCSQFNAVGKFKAAVLKDSGMSEILKDTWPRCG